MAPTAPADRLRAALAAAGLSAAELARRLGVARPSVAQYLTGARVPTLDWLHRAAGAIGCDPQALDPRLASTSTGRRR